MNPRPTPDDPRLDDVEHAWTEETDASFLRDVPLVVDLRVGGALSPAEMEAASRGGAEELMLRAFLESARVSLHDGDTDKALVELEEVHRLLKQVGGARWVEAASELKKDVERSLVARSISPDNAFRVFVEVNDIIHGTADTSERIASALERIAEAVNADRAFMALYDPARRVFQVASAHRLAATAADGILTAIRANDKDFISRGRPVISVGVGSDDRFHFDRTLGEINSLILVPCGAGDETSGVVYLDRLATPGSRSFDQTDLELVTALAASLEVLAVDTRREITERANLDLRRQLNEKYAWHNVVTANKEMKEVLRVLERISASNMTVLLQGETGTGKQLAALAIHHQSPRRQRPFVTIDCAALSAQLLESELFGHMRGAFTGATGDRRGLFEEANSGTVFLDEIDKTNHDLQRRLLHVVDQGEVRPLGAPEYRKVDVRLVVATSHPNLRRLVDEGQFIKDLYFRLNDIAVTLPPLRDRKEDLLILVEHFLHKHSAELGRPGPRGVSRAAMQIMLDHDWPGNVRELEKVLRRAVVLAEEGAEIQPEDLPAEMRAAGASRTGAGAGGAMRSNGATAAGAGAGARAGGADAPDARGGSRGDAPRPLSDEVEELERRVILQVLNRCGWNKSQAARDLGLTRKGLRMKIERYALEGAKLRPD